MDIDSIPIWILGSLWLAVLLITAEIGYRLGQAALRRPKHETDAPVGAIVGSLLALSAFMLAFTFNIVSSRFDARKGLVLQEANAISTAWLRADFLDAAGRSEAHELLASYTDNIIKGATIKDAASLQAARTDVAVIQTRLWAAAVAASNLNPDSQSLTLYIDALNKMFDLHLSRITVSLEARVPGAIWVFLALLLILGLLGVGYQTALQLSRRTAATFILALALSSLITLIILLDNPYSRTLNVSQQPIMSVRAAMEATPPAP